MITTVGPYAKYGRPVVQVSPECICKGHCPPFFQPKPRDSCDHAYLQACVENGTHYCDLTGEALFIRRTMEEFHEEAKAKGVKIVNSCGFDSVPGDVLSLMAAHHMQQQHNKKLAETTAILGDGVLSTLSVSSSHLRLS